MEPHTSKVRRVLSRRNWLGLLGVAAPAAMAAGLIACQGPAAPSPPPAAPSPAPTVATKQSLAQPAASSPAATAKPKPAFTFAGKTVTLLVAYSAGGTADILARQLQPFLAKHLPGNPAVVVQNMPGGGGVVGENWFYNVAPKDGSVVGHHVNVYAHFTFIADQVKYDITKLRWLAGLGEPSATYADAKLGIKTGEDLPKVAETIFMGESSCESIRGHPIRLVLRLLDKDHKVIVGYGSSGDQRAALLRDELNMTQDTLTGYLTTIVPLIQQGRVVAIAQSGALQNGEVVRDPALPDVPTYGELLVRLKGQAIKQTHEFRALELITGMRSLSTSWVYAPGVPEEAIGAMTTAFQKMTADPELIQTVEKNIGFKPAFLSAQQTQQLASSLDQSLAKNPAAVELLKELGRAC